MLLTYVEGDLLRSPAQTLVNTVNTHGVMGSGLARQFKDVYPDMFRAYQDACREKAVDIGQPWVYRTPHKWILNFPTKKDWRERSQLEYIQQGLEAFSGHFRSYGVTSVAFPALGCGNGKLDWSRVRLMMEHYLHPLPIDVFVYPPRPSASLLNYHVPEATRTWLRSEPAVPSAAESWSALVGLAQHHLQARVEWTRPLDGGNPNAVIRWGDAQPFILDERQWGTVWETFCAHGFLPRPAIDWLGPAAEPVWVLLRVLPFTAELICQPLGGKPTPALQLALPSGVPYVQSGDLFQDRT